MKDSSSFFLSSSLYEIFKYVLSFSSVILKFKLAREADHQQGATVDPETV